jgi:mRNA interferase RelE/StbE
MTWNLLIAGPAQKELQRLPQNDLERVKRALLAMRADPFYGDIKRLHGAPIVWRRRVGNYRIIYDLYFDRQVIIIKAILRRTSKTYK